MPEAITGRRERKRNEDRELLLRTAAMHLDRVKQLSDREWKTMILYWTGLLASGAGLISATARIDTIPVLIEIEQWDAFLLAGYYLSAVVFLFGYSGNIYQSLVTERNRYQVAQDWAVEGRMPEELPLIRPTKRTTLKKDGIFAPVPRSDVYRSATWGVKAITTSLFITAIWSLTQLIANARIEGTRREGVRTHCAFKVCELSELQWWNFFHFEAGAIVAAVLLILFAGAGVRALWVSKGP